MEGIAVGAVHTAAVHTAEGEEPLPDIHPGIQQEEAPAEPARRAVLAVVEAVAVKAAARDSAASRESTLASEAPRRLRRLLALRVRRNPGSLFGKAEHPVRIGDISS